MKCTGGIRIYNYRFPANKATALGKKLPGKVRRFMRRTEDREGAAIVQIYQGEEQGILKFAIPYGDEAKRARTVLGGSMQRRNLALVEINMLAASTNTPVSTVRYRITKTLERGETEIACRLQGKLWIELEQGLAIATTSLAG